MIDLSLNRHDFVSAVEGFAHGSHLRQHVWSEIVFPSISQMTDDEMDFFWFIFRLTYGIAISIKTTTGV